MSQFHQHFTHAFYGCVFCTKFWRQKFQSCVLGFEFFDAQISYEKRTRKTLMKLTPCCSSLPLSYNFSVSYNFQQQINIWSKNLILIFLVVLLAQCIAKIMLKAEFTSQYSREQYHHEFEAFSVWKPSKSSFSMQTLFRTFLVDYIWRKIYKSDLN